MCSVTRIYPGGTIEFVSSCPFGPSSASLEDTTK